WTWLPSSAKSAGRTDATTTGETVSAIHATSFVAGDAREAEAGSSSPAAGDRGGEPRLRLLHPFTVRDLPFPHGDAGTRARPGRARRRPRDGDRGAEGDALGLPQPGARGGRGGRRGDRDV